MKVTFMPDAWDDYIYWQTTDKRMLRKINALIRECLRTPHSGSGKPEALKHQLKG